MCSMCTTSCEEPAAAHLHLFESMCLSADGLETDARFYLHVAKRFCAQSQSWGLWQIHIGDLSIIQVCFGAGARNLQGFVARLA